MRFSARYICIIAVAMYAGAAVSLADRVESTPQDGFDSMRGSLRHLLLDQLGQIDEVLVTDRFFSTSLAEQLQSALGVGAYQVALPLEGA